jgi:hypothetical protein
MTTTLAASNRGATMMPTALAQAINNIALHITQITQKQ